MILYNTTASHTSVKQTRGYGARLL